MHVNGSLVKAWDADTQKYEQALIQDIRKDVICCKGIPGNEHIHPLLYDVIFLRNSKVSRGHFPETIKSSEET